MKTNIEKMSTGNSTVNFTTLVTSNDSTTSSLGLKDYIEISVYCINLLFGPPTHSYVVWLIVTGSGVTSEFFTLNLSVCEFGISLDSLVYLLSLWFTSLSSFDWFLGGVSITGRPLFQCLICVERYMAVVHPVIFLKTKPLRYRVICCAVVWMITLGSCLYSMVNLNLHYKAIHTWMFSMQMIVLISIQMFCLVSVLRALKQSGPGERRRDGENNQIKRKAFVIIVITTVTMVVLYVPFAIAGFYEILTGDSSNWFIAFIFFLLAGFVQPVLFLHRAGKLCR